LKPDGSYIGVTIIFTDIGIRQNGVVAEVDSKKGIECF
jgi:hypothetical protein